MTDSLIAAASVFGPPLIMLALLVAVLAMVLRFGFAEIENGRRTEK